MSTAGEKWDTVDDVVKTTAKKGSRGTGDAPAAVSVYSVDKELRTLFAVAEVCAWHC